VYKRQDLDLVIDASRHGANPKIGNLINMLPSARHDILVIADSDVHARPDYLRRLAQALDRPRAGLVTTLYTGLPAFRTVASLLGTTQITHGSVSYTHLDVYKRQIDMVTEGQILDAPAVTRLQTLKTGRLIQFSAEAGAILGRTSHRQRHQIAAYGRDLGAAFQIADDLLDVEGTAEEIGKTTGKDAAAGKATMVAVLGPEMARAHADMLSRQAAAHLDGFGERAALLRELAAFVVMRRS